MKWSFLIGSLEEFVLITLSLAVLYEIAFATSSTSTNENGEDRGYSNFGDRTKTIRDASNKNLLQLRKMLKNGMDFNASIATLSYEVSNSVICRNNPKEYFNCNASYPYRTIDGTCNNVENPTWGSTYTSFLRLVPASYHDGYNDPRGGFVSTLPNARLISTFMHTDQHAPDIKVTNMLMQFGQLVDHDLISGAIIAGDCCGRERKTNPDCFPIDIPFNDTFYSSVGQTCLGFTRTIAHCFPGASKVREQPNSLSAFLDCANIYGSDSVRAEMLREHKGVEPLELNGYWVIAGRLLLSEGGSGLLPTKSQIQRLRNEELKTDGDFVAGDDRVNLTPGLTVLQTLFVREHNRLAREIEKAKPYWTDEIVYQTTRRLMTAQWQKIVYGEFLPTILGPSVMTRYGLNVLSSKHSRYNASVNPSIFHSFATAAYRFGHTLIPGLIQLMRDSELMTTYRIRDSFFTSKEIYSFNGKGYDWILGGLMQQNTQTHDRFVTEDVTNFALKQREYNFGSDLVATNIQRGRDHGLQSYASYRDYCKLSKLRDTWNYRPAEIPQMTWDLFKTLYKTPLDIDLFSAGIAENPLSGAVSGPTFNCLKANQFRNIKDGDRFFYTHQGQAGSFTLLQIKKINARTLGDIVCQNSNTLRTPKNVFRPVSSSNPWVLCNDKFKRQFLSVQDFV